MNCPLCQTPEAELYHRDSSREFFLCSCCTLVFVPRAVLLSASEEKKRYDAHQNDESDPGYREYFLKTVNPVMEQIRHGERGLDFGCGRTQLMGKLFHERGIEMDSFDPYYFPNGAIWNKVFDFAILNEVIEHLRAPAQTLEQLKSIVRGPVFVRTKLYPSKEAEFGRWFYKRDQTHVQFFSPRSLEWIGKVETLADDLYRIDWK